SRDISGLGDVATEARIIAEAAGRATIKYEDVDQAIKQHLIPSDTGFATRMNQPLKGTRKRALRTLESPVQSPYEAPQARSVTAPPVTARRQLADMESEEFAGEHREIKPRMARELVPA
ncbi:MAG TPA: hypothetical protein VIJ24_01330, partial [Verrucomicrobiae bacterium]